MGFNAVYRCLMEMFPQIDTRLLKAVAIEHSKDADVAANIVLTEILPYWSKKSLTSSSISLGQNASSSAIVPSPISPSDEIAEREPAAEREEHEELNTLRRRRNITPCTSLEQGSIINGNSTGTELACAHNSDTTSLDKALNASSVSQSYDPNVRSGQFFGNTESEEVILFGKVGSNIPTAMPNECGYADLSQACASTEFNGLVSLDKSQFTNVKVKPEQTPIVMSTPSLPANGVANGSLTTWNDYDGPGAVKVKPEQTPIVMSTPSLPANGVANGSLTSWNDYDGPGATDIDISNSVVNQEVGSCLDCPLKVDDSVAQLVPSSVQEHTSDVPESSFPLEFVSTSTIDSGQPDAISSSDLMSKQEFSMSEKSDFEDDSTINTVVTRSGQICRIDLLEEMIEDAKNNKKNLFMAMESVMNMMSEVEIQEKAAKTAKAAAEKGGLDIFVKMEGLKKMLAHAKETNDMHAGEINGEKAILTTEARELQNRLLNLSEERDKSLAILDEMLETLEVRLAAAEEMRRAAEEEKFEKEESARAYLAEQEAIMEKVVQESKLLQQQAEENSKLREFLMDRGLVVDSLQGEISVICQDVRLLKEKFDERVPLSKSVSSSQTTCILASSGSSMKSIASLVAEQGQLTTETLEKMSPTPSVDAQSPKIRLDDEKTGDEWRQLSDDGWDLFENETELNGQAM